MQETIGSGADEICFVACSARGARTDLAPDLCCHMLGISQGAKVWLEGSKADVLHVERGMTYGINAHCAGADASSVRQGMTYRMKDPHCDMTIHWTGRIVLKGAARSCLCSSPGPHASI